MPYIGNFVNLIVVSPVRGALREAGDGRLEEEIRRVLAPGGVAVDLAPATGALNPVIRFRKPWPAEMDQWTHYLHGPDGNPTGNDTLVAPPRRLQWLGSPGWARHHDHMASMSALVSANGRLFYILDEGSRASIQLPSDWSLIARDAFNGTILWKREISPWASKDFGLKSGPAHLLRRLVAIGDRVYVTLGIDAPVTILDAASGEARATCEGTQFAREIVVDEDTALLVVGHEALNLPNFRRVGTFVWSNTNASNSGWGWPGTPRSIVACDAATGRLRWRIDSPVAPCSLAAAAQAIVFHDGQKLVCLDQATGQTRWQAEATPLAMPVPSSTGPRVLSYRDMILLAANNGKVSGWTLREGRKVWERVQKPSGHMSLRDLFVVDGLAWTAALAGNADDGVWSGYDPHTGEIRREFAPDVNLHWFHHRCYGQVDGPAAGPDDWPAFRHDPARSGAMPAGLATGGGNWETPLGGHLTQPAIAAGRVFVACRNTHTLHALDAATGQSLWSYTTGGQTDTSPTYWNGLLVFGSADGYVYALRAEDGVLAWRFRAAPLDQRTMAWERLESAWPVHGSVLVREDANGQAVAYCTAGRSIYLDGGIRFLRLDAATGRLLGEVVWDDKDPQSGQGMHEAYLRKTPGNTMPVGLSDVLSCDGRNLWMRSQKIDFEGRRTELTVLPATDQPAEDAHLFCQIGFADDSYFFRSYWTYGRRMTGGYGGWFQAGRYVPSGRVMCFDEHAVYGYGRKPEYMTNASVVEYQLFAANKSVTPEDITRVNRAEQAMSQRRSERNASSSDWRLRWFFPKEDLTATRYRWLVDQPA